MSATNDPNDRNISVPARDTSGSSRPTGRDAAAQLMREQIDKLYESENNTQATNPYHQTHSESADHVASEQNTSQWAQYHTQWQNYYQQYYERYYLAQLARKEQKLAGQKVELQQEPSTPIMVTAGEPEPEPITKSQAANELRNQLISRVTEQSKKFRESRHFVPVLAALIVAFTFIFLQYNSLIFAQVRAFISPGSISPANLIVDPTTDLKVGPEPKIVIPKINVDAPVVYDVPSIKESIVQDKLKSGVVHYPIPGANAMPGQKGNSVILGHSSNDVFDDGQYKFVFVQLNNLEKGDTFYLHYNSIRYTYSVIDKKVIDPTQVSELVINNGKPLATLVTCTPPGTALKRLVVIAEQISPNPNQATEAQQSTESTSDVAIPGNSPTLFERLFGQ